VRHCTWPYSPSDDPPSTFRFESQPTSQTGEVQEPHPSLYMGLLLALNDISAGMESPEVFRLPSILQSVQFLVLPVLPPIGVSHGAAAALF
jgi:hypothetical protein